MINNKKSFRKTFNTITAICLAAAMMLSVGCGRATATTDEYITVSTTTPGIILPGETNIMPTYAVKEENTALGDMAYSEMEGMYDVPMTDYDFNTEEYNYNKETGFLSTLTNPLSTFSVDVDTASYTNIRRMINEGSTIVGDAIRLEEFLNYSSIIS